MPIKTERGLIKHLYDDFLAAANIYLCCLGRLGSPPQQYLRCGGIQKSCHFICS